MNQLSFLLLIFFLWRRHEGMWRVCSLGIVKMGAWVVMWNLLVHRLSFSVAFAEIAGSDFCIPLWFHLLQAERQHTLERWFNIPNNTFNYFLSQLLIIYVSIKVAGLPLGFGHRSLWFAIQYRFCCGLIQGRKREPEVWINHSSHCGNGQQFVSPLLWKANSLTCQEQKVLKNICAFWSAKCSNDD